MTSSGSAARDNHTGVTQPVPVFAPLPIAKADREKLRKTLLTEFRRQVPVLLRSEQIDTLPERARTLLQTLARLDIG